MIHSTSQFIHNRIVDPVLHTSLGKSAYTHAQSAIAGIGRASHRAYNYLAAKTSVLKATVVQPAMDFVFGSEEEFDKDLAKARRKGGRRKSTTLLDENGNPREEEVDELDAEAEAIEMERQEERSRKSLFGRLFRRERVVFARQLLIQIIVAVSVFAFAIGETAFIRWVQPSVGRYLPRGITDAVVRVSLKTFETLKPAGQAVMVVLNKADHKLLGGAVFKFVDDIIKAITKAPKVVS